jgi:hypothetical protein
LQISGPQFESNNKSFWIWLHVDCSLNLRGLQIESKLNPNPVLGENPPLKSTGEIGSGQPSKLASWLWLAFKISELALAGFQNWRVGSGRLSKALGAAPWNLLSNRSKGFELDGFKKLFANTKAFCAKWLRIN